MLRSIPSLLDVEGGSICELVFYCTLYRARCYCARIAGDAASPLQTTVPGEEHQRRLQDFVDELKAMPVAVQVRPPQITGGCRTLAGSGGQPDAGARRLRPPHGVLRSSPALRTGSAPAMLHADGCC